MRHSIGSNVAVEIEKDEIVIRMRRDAQGELSSTGKNFLDATCSNAVIPGTDLKVSLNLMRKNREFVPQPK